MACGRWDWGAAIHLGHRHNDMAPRGYGCHVTHSERRLGHLVDGPVNLLLPSAFNPVNRNLRFILGEVESVTARVDTLVYACPVDDTATPLLRIKSGAQAVGSAAFSIPSEADLNLLEVRGTDGRLWTAPQHAKGSRERASVRAFSGKARVAA